MSKITKTPIKIINPITKAPAKLIAPLVTALDQITITEPAYQDIDRLEQAQNLPEIGLDEPRQNAKTTIQVFKGLDRRTMRVVVSGGVLYQQEI